MHCVLRAVQEAGSFILASAGDHSTSIGLCTCCMTYGDVQEVSAVFTLSVLCSPQGARLVTPIHPDDFVQGKEGLCPKRANNNK